LSVGNNIPKPAYGPGSLCISRDNRGIDCIRPQNIPAMEITGSNNQQSRNITHEKIILNVIIIALSNNPCPGVIPCAVITGDETTAVDVNPISMIVPAYITGTVISANNPLPGIELHVIINNTTVIIAPNSITSIRQDGAIFDYAPITSENDSISIGLYSTLGNRCVRPSSNPSPPIGIGPDKTDLNIRSK